jgi:hypothetical protein
MNGGLWTLVVPHPSHAGDATDGGVGEYIESRGRKIEVGKGATGASVCEGYNNTLALISCSHSLSAQWVVVGVSAIVVREIVEEKMGNSSDVISVFVGDSAGAQAGSVESALAGLCSNQEARQIAIATAARGLGSFRSSGVCCGRSGGVGGDGGGGGGSLGMGGRRLLGCRGGLCDLGGGGNRGDVLDGGRGGGGRGGDGGGGRALPAALGVLALAEGLPRDVYGGGCGDAGSDCAVVDGMVNGMGCCEAVCDSGEGGEEDETLCEGHAERGGGDKKKGVL